MVIYQKHHQVKSFIYEHIYTNMQVSEAVPLVWRKSTVLNTNP